MEHKSETKKGEKKMEVEISERYINPYTPDFVIAPPKNLLRRVWR